MMTLEFQGHSFTFEGRLVDTNIELQQDFYESNPLYPEYIMGPRKFSVSLEIIARDLVQNVL